MILWASLFKGNGFNMYRILTASKDAYITNKIINNAFRVTDANTGKAGTLDLFKLYAESTSGSDTTPTEISRVLLKFDLNPLRALTGSTLDITDSSFKCSLKLDDVYGGQTTPSNFRLILFPLSKSFDEGIGRDVVRYSDLDSANFLTASVSSDTPVTWSYEGANKQGLLGSSNIDIISSGNLSDGSGVVNLWKQQVFADGREDLSIDVTTIISATLKNLIPDRGFRLSFSGSEETDKITRFVKRFSSRESSNTRKRPKLVITFNDAIQDHHESFYFNISGSLFLNNYHRGVAANILSGTAATQITGSNSLILQLKTGSNSRGTYFSKIITASQHKMGSNFISGTYSASFAMSQWASGTLMNEIKNAGSATFTEIWSSLDRSVGFLTSSIVVNSVDRTSFIERPKRLILKIINILSQYRRDDKVKLRVFVEDLGRDIKYKKLPFETKSQIFTKMYYRIRDFDSNDIIVPFHTNGTLLSTDSDGMYFEFYMSSLESGKLYIFDFLIKDLGFDQIFTDVAAKFKVV